MAPNGKRSFKNATNKGKAAANANNMKTLESAANLMGQLKDLLQTPAAETTQSSVKRKQKRLLSERDFDSDDDDIISAGTPKRRNTFREEPATKNDNSSTEKEYASQAVILEGVKPDIKSHPLKLSRAFSETKPGIELKKGGLRRTASGDVLVLPKNPKDCCSLLKPDAFPPNSPLGELVKARLPKSQQITHQVIIKNVDPSVTQEEMEDMLRLQSMEFTAVKRIFSREKNAPTPLFRLILKTEEQKKKLLKEGIFLDQMHFSCMQAREDAKDYPKIKQCYNCQQIGDHLSAECKNPTKCVLCAGPHRKADCTTKKEDYKCANCAENHPAWSLSCSHRTKEIQKNKKPTMAQVASATVTPSLLDDVLNQLKEHIAMVIAEVVSRCICELTLDLVGKNLSKVGLPLMVATIVKNTTNAINKGTYGTKSVDETSLKTSILNKCFPKSPAPTTSQNPNALTSDQNV